MSADAPQEKTAPEAIGIPAAGSGAAAGPRATAGLLVVGLGILTAPLDSSVNIAFPFITRAFDAPLEAIQWVVICYVLTYSSLMLVFGKLGDLFGHRRVFAAGLALSAIAYALCGTADTFGMLLGFRVLQGIGTALVLSCGPALATMLFPEAMRARVLGAYTVMFGVGAALGPSLGGLLIAEWGWAAVFWFRAPLSAATLLFLFLLPRAQHSPLPRPFDAAGAALLIAGLSSFVLAVNQARHAEEGALLPIALALAAVACTVGFVLQERRAPEPILRPGLFRDLRFSVINFANVVVNLAGFAVMFLVPYFLDRMAGLSVVLAGAVLATSPAGLMLAGPVGGRLLGRFDAPRLALAGALLVGGGLLSVGQWGNAAPVAAIAASLVAVGFGLGLFQVAYLEIVTGRLPPSDRGVAGSLAMVTRTVGVVGGATCLTLLFAAFTPAGGSAGAAAFLTAFSATFTTVGGGLLGFLLLTLLRPDIWLRSATPR